METVVNDLSFNTMFDYNNSLSRAQSPRESIVCTSGTSYIYLDFSSINNQMIIVRTSSKHFHLTFECLFSDSCLDTTILNLGSLYNSFIYSLLIK